ncbi:hypothetical protein FB566_3447 [Stackebrandtia endophytica]|uniref:Uncharacterized protein n=1 Tax=Stackebrandtia endophytica TaxID=1496996 RepID=A0A543AZ91_9ACTN|nr:hypothetical protein [Stackebrandtia endophytica]TQL77876.1 hypothetical protein FB566_3447 [Stackebrandtia endophytica]
MLTKLWTQLPWNRKSYIGRHRAAPRYFGDSDGIDSVVQLLGVGGRGKST